jgi:glycosyltransferase involved in cell wall biosynthesis
MDRHVPPRIAYWLNSFEPEMEAIAGEVALLRRHFPSSVAWGLTHRRWLLLSWRRGFALHPKLHLLFRAATRILEPAFNLNHIFGSLGDWFYLVGGRRRPTILTMAADESPADRCLLQKVRYFVAESPAGRDAALRRGIERDRVRLIFPGTDLEHFSPSPPPDGPFTVLFASSPERADWLEARGLPRLLDAAALRPRMVFRLLWRPWGNSEPVMRKWIADRGLRNVELVVGLCKDMAHHYRAAHATVAPFADPSRCKPVPNSLIESMACGRPVLASEAVNLAEVIREAGAGLVCPLQGEAIAENLDRLQADWDVFSRSARALAERRFGTKQFLEGYQQVYDEVLR